MKEENFGKPVRRPLLFGGDAQLARGAAPGASPTSTGSAVPGGQGRAEPCPGSGRRSWADPPPRLFHPSLARGRRQEPVNTRSLNARKKPTERDGTKSKPRTRHPRRPSLNCGSAPAARSPRRDQAAPLRPRRPSPWLTSRRA